MCSVSHINNLSLKSTSGLWPEPYEDTQSCVKRFTAHPSTSCSSSHLVFSSLDAAGEAFGEELPICLEAFSKNLVLDATYDGGVSSV